jgi:hypothetical protein
MILCIPFPPFLYALSCRGTYTVHSEYRYLARVIRRKTGADLR